MDSEPKEKLSRHASDTNGDVALTTTSNVANESEHTKTDATEGSVVYHAGHEGSGMALPLQLRLTRVRGCDGE